MGTVLLSRDMGTVLLSYFIRIKYDNRTVPDVTP